MLSVNLSLMTRKRQSTASGIVTTPRSTRSQTRAQQVKQQQIFGADVGVIAQITSPNTSRKRPRIATATDPESGKRYKGYVYAETMEVDEEDRESIFEKLPVEMLQLVLIHLDGRSLLNLFATRKGVAILLSSGFWKQLYIQRHTDKSFTKIIECCPLGHVHDVAMNVYIYSPIMNTTKAMINYSLSYSSQSFDMDVIKSKVYDWKTQLVLSSNFVSDPVTKCTMCGCKDLDVIHCNKFGVRLCKACCFRHLIPRSMVDQWCLRENQLGGLPIFNLCFHGPASTRRDSTYWFSRHLKALQQQAYPSVDLLKGRLDELVADEQELREEFERRDAIVSSILASHGINSFTELHDFVQTIDAGTKYEVLNSLSNYYQKGTCKQSTRRHVTRIKKGKKAKKDDQSNASHENSLLVNEAKARCTRAEAEVMRESLQTALNKLDRRRARLEALNQSLEKSKHSRNTLEKSKKAKDTLTKYVNGDLPPKTFDALGDVDEAARAKFVVKNATKEYDIYSRNLSNRKATIDTLIPKFLNEDNYQYSYGMDKKAWLDAFESQMVTYPEYEPPIHHLLIPFKEIINQAQVLQRKTRLENEVIKIDPALAEPMQTLSKYFDLWHAAVSTHLKKTTPTPPRDLPADAPKLYIKAIFPNVTHRIAKHCRHNPATHTTVCIPREAPELAQVLAMRSMHYVDEFIRTTYDEDFNGLNSLGNEEAKALYQKLAKQPNLLTEEQAPAQAKLLWRMESVHRCLRFAMLHYSQPSGLTADAHVKYLELCHNEESLVNKCTEIEKLEKRRLDRRDLAIKIVKDSGLTDKLVDTFNKSTKIRGTHRATGTEETWLQQTKTRAIDVIMVEWLHSDFSEDALRKALEPKLKMEARDARKEQLARKLAKNEDFIRQYCLSYSSRWNSHRINSSKWDPRAVTMDSFAE